MLIVVHKGREEEVKRIFYKWDLPWAEIGTVTDTGRMVVRHTAKLSSTSPPANSPTTPRSITAKPANRRISPSGPRLPPRRHSRHHQPGADLKALLAWPTIASKNWVYRQYDHMVRDGSVVCPGSDAAVSSESSPIRCPPRPAPHPRNLRPFPKYSWRSPSTATAGYVYLDPYEGGKIAVTEAARNLACTGAVPLGVTDNLNYGNPHNLDIFWQLKESVRGLAEACRAFNTPVTGGNVSLYNQRGALGAIDPTPTVAVVGVIENPDHVTTQWFKDEGDAILLLGEPVDLADPLQGLGGSAYLQLLHGQKTGNPPRCDLEQAKTLHRCLLGLIQSGGIKSAHDCSEGGLAVALAESCISQQIAREHAPPDRSQDRFIRADQPARGRTALRRNPKPGGRIHDPPGCDQGH